MKCISDEPTAKESRHSYAAMVEKTFKNAVFHHIESNYGNLGGGKKLSDLLATDIDELASKYFVSREFIKPGQMVLSVVCKSDTPRVGKRMKDTEIKPVVVTLISEEEMRQWLDGTSKAILKKNRMARIATEVFEQVGVVSLGDLSLIQLCCVNTTSKYVHRYEKEQDIVLPYRGTIHDLGPTMTHKEVITDQVLNGKSHSQVKAATGHSTKAICNYVKAYRRVVLLRNSGYPEEDISFITGMSKKLVKQYLKLGEKHNWKVV